MYVNVLQQMMNIVPPHGLDAVEGVCGRRPQSISAQNVFSPRHRHFVDHPPLCATQQVNTPTHQLTRPHLNQHAHT
jgi:hypothetical protein